MGEMHSDFYQQLGGGLPAEGLFWTAAVRKQRVGLVEFRLFVSLFPITTSDQEKKKPRPDWPWLVYAQDRI